MGLASPQIEAVLEGYDRDNLTIATFCSHSSLQIFHGAKKEGFRTLGIANRVRPVKFYDAFPLARPDDFLIMDSYKNIVDHIEELQEQNTVIVPHGSVVEYLGPELFNEIPIPTYGNRAILEWEADRHRQREWLERAGCKMPHEIKDPRTIKGPTMVKYDGARGGRGFFICKDFESYQKHVDPELNVHIQEYVLGTRYYIHFFFTPFEKDGYQVDGVPGRLELLSMDRRDETNIDEMYKLGSQETLKEFGLYPTFVVTGNVPLVVRESLLPRVFEMGENVVKVANELTPGGIVGSFCLETVVMDNLQFKVFEISARIVAGTNPFIRGAPYSDLAYEDPISTGVRIAREIEKGAAENRLSEILS